MWGFCCLKNDHLKAVAPRLLCATCPANTQRYRIRIQPVYLIRRRLCLKLYCDSATEFTPKLRLQPDLVGYFKPWLEYDAYREPVNLVTESSHDQHTGVQRPGIEWTYWILMLRCKSMLEKRHSRIIGAFVPWVIYLNVASLHCQENPE